jgi:OPA family glycerol-3-phosphate transporter-like MFS transporter
MNIADLSPRLRAEVLQTERKVIEDASGAKPVPEGSLLRHPVIWAHCLGIGFWLVFYLTITAFGQTMMVQAFGKTPAEASSIMAGFWVLDIIAVVVVGRWSDTLQLRRIFTVVFTLILIVLLAYFAHLMGQPGTSTTTLVITGALIGGALGGAYSPWMAMYSENAEDIDPRLQGMAWGLFNFMVRIVAVAVVILAPMVVEHTGSWRNWIIASGGCVVFFLIAMAFFVKGPWTTRQRLAEAAHSQAAVATH